MRLSEAYAVRRPVVNAYLVRQRDRRRRRELGLLLLAVVPVAVGLLCYVWLQIELVGIGYRIHRLEQILETREQTQRRLQMEAAYLSGPQQIRSRAVEELGMAAPTVEQMVFAEELE